MNRPMVLPALLLLGLFFAATGCASNPEIKVREFDATVSQQNHGYALLYTLVAKNKNVDQLLSIKSVTPPTAEVIKDIAKLCADAKTRLEAFAKEDPELNLINHGLPLYEQETREAIESTTTMRLLFVTGDVLEVRLLQTQTQSTDYLAHLALLIGKNEKNKERAEYLTKLSKQSQVYFNQCMARLAINHASTQPETKD